jgi:iron complex transport system substrate-binding protein
MIKKYFCSFVLILVWWEVGLAEIVTVTDQAGRTVRVKQPVNRVVTTFIPATLFALCSDLEDLLVGASNKDGTASIYEALIDQRKPPTLVGNRTAGLSLETICSLKPDLVIMYGQKDGVRLADRLIFLGIPAIVIMPESMAHMTDTLDLIGKAAGKKAHTDRIINAINGIQVMMEGKLAGTDRHKVYYAASTLLSTVSGDMLQNEMISLAGGTNVSEKARGFFVTISREQLLSWNPSIIIASDRLSLAAEKKLGSPEFSMVQAVKGKKIFKIPTETYWDFPSPLAMAGVLWMAGKIHPEVFSHGMVRAEIDNLYDTVFGMGFSRKHPKIVGENKGL